MKDQYNTNLKRRAILKGLAAIGTTGVLASMGIRPVQAAPTVNMGFIYVGPRGDYGYNQSHYEGKSSVANESWVKAVDEEKVPETIEVQKTMESMINLDGAQVLFPTSFGYFDPHILKVAPKYPDVMFLHCGGLWDAKKHPKNVGSYFGYIDEPATIPDRYTGSSI